MELVNYIKERRSTRRYSEKQIDDALIQQSLLMSNNFINIDEKKSVRFIPLAGSSKFDEIFKKAFGDYGKLFNAPFYFGIAVSNNHKSKNTVTGFMGEQMVLALTSLGYSTCWLSTDDPLLFRNIFSANEGEVIPALISVGFPSTDFQGKIVNKMLGKTSGKRKKIKHLVYINSTKTKASTADIKEAGLDEVFEMSRLAPSWHNVQPWLFIIKENKVYLIMHLDEKRYRAKSAEKRKYFHSIDMGVIMSHVSLVRKKNGFNTEWKILTEKEAFNEKSMFNLKDSLGTPFAYFNYGE